MRVRHRIPMVFSLSMLDVFCCALGCVTLLWLVNQREAMLSARNASGLQTNLAAATSDLQTLRSQLAAALAERDQSQKSAARLRDDLDSARQQADQLTKDLAAVTRKSEEAADRIAKQAADLLTLTRDAKASKARIKELAEELTDELARVAAADKKAADLAARLRDAESAASKLKSTADMVPGLRDAAAEKSEQLTQTQARLKSVEGELDASRRMMAGLEGDKKELAGKLARARFAVENRFEGIALTGKRVVFLVDMSGSMELVDSNTNAPNKWAGVRETLLKLFRSLPELEKFQVILFSDKITYLMGNEGKWLDPDPKSADRLHAAMSATVPKGNTDMYLALEAAFGYRANGLDTIYLLSDGLPNVGAGLTAEAARNMRETERAEVLSRHIRQTLKNTWNIGRTKVRINAVGFFYESPDVGAFLWALSRENDGSFVGMSKP